MPKTLFYLLWLVLASAPLSADLATAFETLSGDDYGARQEARLEIAAAVNAATAPGTPAAERARLASFLAAESGPDIPFPRRDWAIRQIGVLGEEASVDALTALLEDPDPRIRDLARKSMERIGGQAALRALAWHLGEAETVEDRIGALQALGVFGGSGTPAVAKIAAYLPVDDEGEAAAASNALVRIGGEDAHEALLQAASSAQTPERAALLQTALLHFDLTAEALAGLARNGANSAIRAGAFSELIAVSPEQALAVLRETEGPIRLDFLHSLAGNAETAPLILDQFPALSVAEQQVVLAAASQAGIGAAEAPAINVLEQSEDETLRTTALFALIRIGGEAAWPVLLSQYEGTSGLTRTLYGRALGALRAPSLDERLFADARSGSTEERIAAIDLLALRNPKGSTALLNEIIAEGTNPAVVGAAFQAAETLGDFKTLEMLIARVLREDDPQILRKAQISAKRVTAGTDDYPRAWEEFYAPALTSADMGVAVKERLAVILDAVPYEGTLAYMQDTALEGPPELRNAVIRNFIRWTDIRAIDVIVFLLENGNPDPREQLVLWQAAMRVLTSEDPNSNVGWDETVERGKVLFLLADEETQREILEHMTSKAKYHTRKARESFLEIENLTESQRAMIEEILQT